MNNHQQQTILIVDDSRTNIAALSSLLKDEWLIKVATNGEDALRIAWSKNPPDLILLDVIMPGIDGYEVCRQLKEAPESKDIPVIFITAMDSPDDEERGLKLGAIDYITKPFSAPIVKARVQNHLELKRLRDMLKESSMIDGLTGVANKRRFNEVLTAEWRRSIRHEETLSLVMLDIDYFKNYNDTYGHLQGDVCLKKVADALRQSARRAEDLVARWGGEEFACLLPNTHQRDALQLAEDIRQSILSLKIPHKASQVAEYVTVSLGVASLAPAQGGYEQGLVEEADKALYEAKKDGRNRVGTSRIVSFPSIRRT